MDECGVQVLCSFLNCILEVQLEDDLILQSLQDGHLICELIKRFTGSDASGWEGAIRFMQGARGIPLFDPTTLKVNQDSFMCFVVETVKTVLCHDLQLKTSPEAILNDWLSKNDTQFWRNKVCWSASEELSSHPLSRFIQNALIRHQSRRSQSFSAPIETSRPSQPFSTPPRQRRHSGPASHSQPLTPLDFFNEEQRYMDELEAHARRLKAIYENLPDPLLLCRAIFGDLRMETLTQGCTRKGILKRQESYLIGSMWVERIFVLRENFLFWFKKSSNDRSHEEAVGCLRLGDCKTEITDGTLTISNAKKTLVLCGDDLMAWRRDIQSASEWWQCL